MLLLDAFRDTEPELSQQIQDLYAKCPALFSQILPRSEQTIDDIDNEAVPLKDDKGHRTPTALLKLQVKYCRNTLKLPTRPSQMNTEFYRALQIAYDRDYGMKNIIHMGRDPIQWWKKFSFYDPYVLYSLPSINKYNVK